MKTNKYISNYVVIIIIGVICLSLFSCQKPPELKGDIEGTVKATTNLLPVEGALVELVTTDDSTRTDSLGNYLLTGITPGDYEIKISKTGYIDEREDVKVLSGQTISEHFSLQGIPVLSTSNEYLDFELEQTELKLGISNIGLGELTYYVDPGQDWITVDPDEGTLTDETDSLTVTIDKTATNDSTYSGTIEITVTNGVDITIDVYVNRFFTDARDSVKYKVVSIGNQWWMAENLKSTIYADGMPLVDGTGAGDILGDSLTKYYFAYDDDESYVNTYGRLYTWAAVMNGAPASDLMPSGVQGICPDGWHVPSDSEWKELEMNLGMTKEEADNEGMRGTIGGKMKEVGTTHWASPNEGATNESGFTALPAGKRLAVPGFVMIDTMACFWSTTEFYAIGYGSAAFIRQLGYNAIHVRRTGWIWELGFSLRCVKDPGK